MNLKIIYIKSSKIPKTKEENIYKNQVCNTQEIS